MDLNQSSDNKIPSQEHINFINKLNDAKIPRQSQLIANRLFMKNFSRETTSKEIENYFQSFGPVHDVKIIAKENTHFAFISFVHDNTALDILRQHAIEPLMFQNRPVILAPAYKKTNASSATSPTTYCPGNNSAMTPPPTPSRTVPNGISQQPSTPYQQSQQQLSGQHAIYSPIYLPLQANMPFVPMTGTYIIPQGPTPPHHPLPPSFYPAFYTQGTHHQTAGQIINGVCQTAYVPSPYIYSMGPPPPPTVPTQYQSMATTNDVSLTSEY